MAMVVVAACTRILCLVAIASAYARMNRCCLVRSHTFVCRSRARADEPSLNVSPHTVVRRRVVATARSDEPMTNGELAWETVSHPRMNRTGRGRRPMWTSRPAHARMNRLDPTTLLA